MGQRFPGEIAGILVRLKEGMGAEAWLRGGGPAGIAAKRGSGTRRFRC